MKEFKCSVAREGFFAGPVFLIRSVEINRERQTADSAKEMETVRSATADLEEKIASNGASGRNADIQETVLSILEDELFISKIEEKIVNESLSAPAAVIRASEELAGMLDRVDSEYIRSRQEDIRGVAHRLVSVLERTENAPSECSAVCGKEISPALLSSFDEALAGGILTEKGSPNSHAAIIAGSLNIPYLYGNGEAVAEAGKAGFIIIDSENGIVITDPDEETKKAALMKMEQIVEKRKAEEDGQYIPECRTRVYANIEGPQDIPALLSSGADGVGLYRTEFLFLGREDIPSEQEQFEAYSAVLEAMGEKEVIIRTMDIGSDKKVSWLDIPEESNPALGLRGVRVSLERSELFNTQLRALLRAGVKGNLKVMFPMIASPWEIDEIKARVSDAAQRLQSAGEEYKIPALGIMVETPAAAICAGKLAEKADFFSIGTNDLTQYTLAIDREALGLERYFNPHHEAVYSLIAMTVEGGHRHGIETGVCGQLAADSSAVKRLIGCGVDELSVPVRKVRAVKQMAAEAERELDEGKKPAQGAVPGVAAAADGELIDMKNIPDPVFAEGILGECFGIMPSDRKIYSPVTGEVIAIAEAGHAVTIKDDSGADILVHAGIDTVGLGGKAFTHHVKVGDRVQRDQLIMESDLDMIKAAGLSPMVIVVALK